MSYQMTIQGNYLIIVDTDNPTADLVNEHSADIRMERGTGRYINLYSKSQKRYLPAQNVFTDENLYDTNDDRLFASPAEAHTFFRENTGLGFNTPAGGSAGLSEANVFTEDNTFLGNVEITGSCIAGVGDFGVLATTELPSPPTTAELEELQWKVFVVAGVARVYINIGGTIFSSGLFS